MSNKITITIENPTVSQLQALALAESGSHVPSVREAQDAYVQGALDELTEMFKNLVPEMNVNITSDDYEETKTRADEDEVEVDEDGGNVIDRGTMFTVDIGDRVHWQGAKFTFSGEVTNVFIQDGDNDKVVYIRADNGKLYSLTNADLDTNGLRTA